MNRRQWLLRMLAGLAGAKALLAASVSAEDCLPSPEPVLEIKAGRDGRLIVVPVLLPGGREVMFLVDTGSSITVFDSDLRPESARPISMRVLRTPAGDIQSRLFAPPKAKLGPFDLGTLPGIVYLDLQEIRQATGDEIMGVLGMDFLRHFAIEINPDEGKLRFWRTAPHVWSRQPRISLIDCNGIYGVPISLPDVGREVFVIDTGATTSTIDSQVFDTLVKSGALYAAPSQSAVTVGGEVNDATGYLSRMDLGEDCVKGARCDRASSNALGLRPLSRWSLRIDFASMSLYLAKGKRFSVPERAATCGMAVVFVGVDVVVKSVEPNGPANVAGIQSTDVLLAINGRDIRDYDRQRLSEEFTCVPDRTILIQYRRGQAVHSTQVTTKSRYDVAKLPKK